MTTRHLPRPATVGAVAALMLTGAGLAACGSSKSASSSSASSAPTTTAAPAAATTTGSAASSGKDKTVAVKLSEFKITTAAPSVAAGRVVFTVTNIGKVKHQFTVIRTTKAAATVLSKQNPNDDIPGAKGEIASLAPGATKKLVMRKLKPGHYALVCALPGHYQSGMHADLTVV